MDLVPLVSLSEHLTETKPNEMDNVDSEEEAVNYDNPMYDAKTCLEFISTLNGHDDIGVFFAWGGENAITHAQWPASLGYVGVGRMSLPYPLKTPPPSSSA